MRCELYRLTSPSGKQYIGISKNAKRRWTAHETEAIQNNSHLPLHKSIRKYGFQSFKKEILLIGNRQYCLLMEKLCVEFFNTKRPIGYNVIDGGSAPGEDADMASRRSIAMLGNKIWVGRKHRESTRLKMSKNLIGNTYTKGKIRSKEAVAKAAEKVRGQKRTEEQNKECEKRRKDRMLPEQGKFQTEQIIAQTKFGLMTGQDHLE